MDVSTMFSQLNKIIQKNSPSILTGLGVAGLITTVVMAVTATPKAIALIHEAEYDEDEEGTRGVVSVELEPLEVIKVAYRPYIPAAVMGAATIACIVGSNKLSKQRYSALAAMFALTDAAAREYAEKVKEIIGEKKEQEVRDAIAQDAVDSHPLNNQSIIITGSGTTLCFDKLSGRYFTSDMQKILKVEVEYNRLLQRRDFLSLNCLYEELGLETIIMGEELGWAATNLLEFKFSSRLTPDGEPCLVVDYAVSPRRI